MSNSNYSESVKRLRAFLKEKEEKRRGWAKENWSHSGGKLFKIGRVAVPVLAVIGMFLMIVVCLVRFMNIPEIGRALAGNANGLNSTAKDDPAIYPFFVLVFIAVCMLIYTSLRFIKAKYKNSSFYLFGVSLFLSICALLRYGADQGSFPDNSNYDGAPAFTYFEYCLFTLGVFAFLTVYALILMIIELRDKAEFKRTVEHTLLKIIPKEKSGDLLTEEEYSKLIDEYISAENEKQELQTLSKKEAKKRKKSLKNKTENSENQ